MTKPRVRVLAVMWGKKYIDDFVDVSGPALLAPGNLPALTENCDCEFVFLTRAADIAAIEAASIHRKLRVHAAISFIAIDDLIVPGLMGYTLTSAYARGILELGPAMTGTHFMFLNADFVLADGSLKTLAQKIAEGHAVVMAPSLRCNQEDVFPLLKSAIDPTSGALVVSPREAVRHTLSALHPTVVANTVSQPFTHSKVANQFFWRVDDDTLLAHFLLLFMLCIRPTREVTGFSGFCDYAFVPEMCPNGPITVLDDSDACFILEMQSRKQEVATLALGKADTSDIARQLSEWTTKEHRLYFAKPILFHAEDVPASTGKVAAEAAGYIKDITDRLNPKPQPARDHPYWLGAIERRDEIEAQRVRSAAKPGSDHISLARQAFRLLAGVAPDVTPLHFDWNEYRLVAGALRELVGPGASVLYVATGSAAFDRFMLDQDVTCVKSDVRALLQDGDSVNGAPKPSGAFVYLPPADAGLARPLLRKLADRLAPGARIVVMVHDVIPDPEGESFARRLLLDLGDLSAIGLGFENVVFAGGLSRSLIRAAIYRNADLFANSRWRFAAKPFAALCFLFPVMVVANLFEALRSNGATKQVTSCLVFEATVTARR